MGAPNPHWRQQVKIHHSRVRVTAAVGAATGLVATGVIAISAAHASPGTTVRAAANAQPARAATAPGAKPARVRAAAEKRGAAVPTKGGGGRFRLFPAGGEAIFTGGG